MLWSADNLRGYALRATDGAIGEVHDLYFDDQSWTVRYLVADTSRWLFGRRVLIAPAALGEPDVQAREIPVALSKEKIENSPDVDTEKPVSRQQQIRLHDYYGWPAYWASPVAAGGVAPAYVGAGFRTDDAYARGAAVHPARERSTVERELEERVQQERQENAHLRSMREVTGYGIAATDGSIGHVEDFLIDAEGWQVRYLVIDTRNWLPGKKVIVAPEWVSAIDWANGEVAVEMSREQVKGSPEYDPARAVDRAYEESLYGWYGRRPYW